MTNVILKFRNLYLFVDSCYGTDAIVQLIHWLTDFQKIIEYHNGYNKHYIQPIACAWLMYFCYTEDLLTYKILQRYATKYIHIYNMKYNKMPF